MSGSWGGERTAPGSRGSDRTEPRTT